VLSNCVNSGIRRIGVLTSTRPLPDHHLVRAGAPAGEFGEFLEILPASQRTSNNWYAGPRMPVPELDIIRTTGGLCLRAGGRSHYKMDYGRCWLSQERGGHDCRLRAGELEEARGFGVMAVDGTGACRIRREAARAGHCPRTRQAWLDGIYVVNTEFLYGELIRDAATPVRSRFGRSIIPALIDAPRCTRTLYDPVSASRLLARVGPSMRTGRQHGARGAAPELDLYDSSGHTHLPAQLPSAKFLLDDQDAVGRRQ